MRPGTKKLLKWVGYPVFAVVCFVYAMHLTFPYEQLQPKLQQAAGEGFELELGSIGPGWFPGDVIVKDAVLRSMPKREGDKPVEFMIDRLDIDLGLWAALSKNAVVDVRAQIGEGVIDASLRADAEAAVLTVHSADLPLGDLPGVASATGGLPMDGGLSLDANLRLPVKKQDGKAGGPEPKGRTYTWREAEGKIELSCAGCTVGDGKTAVRANSSNPSAASSGGLTLPKLRLGEFKGTLVIAKGIGKLENFGGKSPDGEVIVEAQLTLDDPFARTEVLGYMRFKADESLAKRDDKMRDMLTISRGTAERPDGYMGVRIQGPINGLRFFGAKVSPLPEGDGATAAGGRKPPKDRANRPTREPTVPPAGDPAAAMPGGPPPGGPGAPGGPSDAPPPGMTPPPEGGQPPNGQPGSLYGSPPPGTEPSPPPQPEPSPPPVQPEPVPAPAAPAPPPPVEEQPHVQIE